MRVHYNVAMDMYWPLIAQVSDLDWPMRQIVITVLTAPGWLTVSWLVWMAWRRSVADWEWVAFVVFAVLSCIWFAWLFSH